MTKFLAEQTEPAKKDTTPLNTESGHTVKSDPTHISGVGRSKTGTFKKKVSSEPESATGQARSREPGPGKKASSGETGPAFKSETLPLEK